MEWSKVVIANSGKVSVSPNLVKKREEMLKQNVHSSNIEEMLYIFNRNKDMRFDKYMVCSLLSDMSRRELLHDKIFFQKAFAKFPKHSFKLALLISEYLLHDTNFMMEMYTLTKERELFAK
jgi:hypothetical protein